MLKIILEYLYQSFLTHEIKYASLFSFCGELYYLYANQLQKNNLSLNQVFLNK